MSVNQVQRRTGLNQVYFGANSSKLRMVDETGSLTDLSGNQMGRSSNNSDKMDFATFLQQHQDDEDTSEQVTEHDSHAIAVKEFYNISGRNACDNYSSLISNVSQVSYDKNPVKYIKPGDYFSRANSDGVIVYNGVNINCDVEKNTLSIGDVSDDENVFRVNLSGGKVLKVERKDMDLIPKVFNMFTPEDQKKIVAAILADKQLQKVKNEMEDDKLKIGK